MFRGQFLTNLLTFESVVTVRNGLPIVIYAIESDMNVWMLLIEMATDNVLRIFYSIFSMYSRAICAIHSLLSLEESCAEKLRDICPTTLLTRGFSFVWSMKLWTIWLMLSFLTPELSMSSVPFFGSRM